MPDTTITALPSASALSTSVVAADNSAGTLTSKVTLGSIAALGGGPPGAHAASHATGGTDVITPASIGAVSTSDSRLTDSRTPSAHKTSHATGNSDALSPADIGAAPANHTQALSTITDAGTAASRNVPASGNATSSQVVLGSDTRLADSRTPTAHASTHRSSGADYVAPVILSPTLSANTNDWNPGTADIIWLTASSAITITGLNASAIDGFSVLLVNVGSNNITLAHETTSTPANRFTSAYGANYVLYPAGGSATLVYHAASSRWRIL